MPSNLPPGTWDGDPRAPWNQGPDTTCQNCGEEVCSGDDCPFCGEYVPTDDEVAYDLACDKADAMRKEGRER